MPTDQERLTAIEEGLNETNHHVTMIKGMVTDQEADIKAMRSQLEHMNSHLDGMNIRLDGMDAHLEILRRQVASVEGRLSEQGVSFASLAREVAAIDQRFDVSAAAMNQRLETIIALLTGGSGATPPES